MPNEETKYNHVATAAELFEHPEIFPEGTLDGYVVELTEAQLEVLGLKVRTVTEDDTSLLATGDFKVGDTFEYTLEPLTNTYTVLVEWDVADTNSPYAGTHAVGSVVAVDEDTAGPLVADGTLELVDASQSQNNDEQQQEETPAEPVVPPTPVKKYSGQVVVSDGFSTINGIQYHHIRIGDGTEYDLNDADYSEYVIEN